MEFLFVSNYGFWKTHYTFIIKSDLKKTLSTVRCQALKSWLLVSTYVHEYAFKAGGESDLIHKLLFFKFDLFSFSCLFTHTDSELTIIYK